jgi:hypothetical protein
MSAAEREPSIPSIIDVARAALKASDGDVQRATKLLARRVRADVVLYRALLDRMVETACYEAVVTVTQRNRDMVWTPPNYDKGGNGGRVRALAAGNALMFFPLPGGKLLAHANRREIEEAAAFYGKQAADMTWKARWLSLVAKHVEGNKTVAKCMTEQQLAKLQERAANE